MKKERVNLHIPIYVQIYSICSITEQNDADKRKKWR